MLDEQNFSKYQSSFSNFVAIKFHNRQHARVHLIKYAHGFMTTCLLQLYNLISLWTPVIYTYIHTYPYSLRLPHWQMQHWPSINKVIMMEIDQLLNKTENNSAQIKCFIVAMFCVINFLPWVNDISNNVLSKSIIPRLYKLPLITGNQVVKNTLKWNHT